MIELIVQLSDGATVVHPLEDGIVTIGRGTDNVITIAEDSVSRHHAEVRSAVGVYTIRDLDSANGTTVNGQPITEWAPEDGDILCFGTVQATWVVGTPLPTPVEPASVTETSRLPLGKRRALILGVVVLGGLSAIVLLVHGPRHANGRTPEVGAIDKQKGQPTRTFWDKIHQIEGAGNELNKHQSFGEYPRLAQGMYDFRWFDDKAFESFLEKVNTRSQRGDQIASEINRLDRSGVDADLLAYTDELRDQWKSASDLDLYFAQYVSALYKQHKEPGHPPNPDDIQALEQEWVTKRNVLQAQTKTVIAREASTGTLLTRRYQMAFKY